MRIYRLMALSLQKACHAGKLVSVVSSRPHRVIFSVNDSFKQIQTFQLSNQDIKSCEGRLSRR